MANAINITVMDEYKVTGSLEKKEWAADKTPFAFTVDCKGLPGTQWQETFFRNWKVQLNAKLKTMTEAEALAWIKANNGGTVSITFPFSSVAVSEKFNQCLGAIKTVLELMGLEDDALPDALDKVWGAENVRQVLAGIDPWAVVVGESKPKTNGKGKDSATPKDSGKKLSDLPTEVKEEILLAIKDVRKANPKMSKAEIIEEVKRTTPIPAKWGWHADMLLDVNIK